MTIKKNTIMHLVAIATLVLHILNTENFTIAWNAIVKTMKSKAAY